MKRVFILIILAFGVMSLQLRLQTKSKAYIDSWGNIVVPTPGLMGSTR